MIHKFGRRSIPWTMAAARMLLGPILIVGERCGWSGLVLAGIVLSALISDIFDGVLARRWQCDTAGVRLFDSMADTVFYLSAGVALWIGQPHIWRDNALLLGTLALLETIRFIIDFARFGKPASYHSYLAKTWGLVMALAVIASFASGTASRLLPLALVLGIATDVEGLAMSLLLPVWRKDVKTIAAALRLRRELVSSTPRVNGRAAPIGATLGALMIVLLSTTPALALEHNQAVYIGGSAPLAPDSTAIVDTASPSTLLLHYRNPDGSLGQVAIDYASIRSAQPTKEVTHHLGVAPAIAVGLMAARQHRYFLTLTWTDAAGAAQVVILETSRRDQDSLLAVIRVRMPHPCPGPASPCVQRPSPRRVP